MSAPQAFRAAARRWLGGARGFQASAVAQDKITCTVDGNEVEVERGATVLQACDAAGVDVPRFCYHQRLSIAGNCRMCLVEVEKAPKPVASCAMPLAPGMNIKTTTPLVRKAREGVMEFLLANHPLDCPICDQGGECDLQDMSMNFGSDRGRFTEAKRSVTDKNVGPLVKTVMTRCIHCTRCVRFATEVAGVQDMGTTGRGRDTEVGTYVEKLMTSELSGNVIDLCPVGALTSKPYAFTSRQWELKGTETVDAMDAMGSSIRVDSRGSEVMRVVPRLNEDVNEEWITDRSRFSYDGLKRQRLTTPYVRRGGATLEPATWEEALEAVAAAVAATPGQAVAAVAGKHADAESLIALKDLMSALGSDDLSHEDDGLADADGRAGYLLNAGIPAVEEADCVLLVGVNPRLEAPLLNLRMMRASKALTQAAASVGEPLKGKLQYPVADLGDSTSVLKGIADGTHPFCVQLARAKRPMVVVGSSVLGRDDAAGVLAAARAVADGAGAGAQGFAVLHRSASRAAALDVGFVPGPSAAVDKEGRAAARQLVYLLGADDYDDAAVPADAFVVYQGSHGDKGASRADVVLPGAAYTEKAATYVNLEGRAQRTKPAVPPVGDARDDWKVVRALSEVCGAPLPYDTAAGVRARLSAVAPAAGALDTLEAASDLGGVVGAAPPMSAAPIANAGPAFYQVDAITRASRTMAKCIQAKEAGQPNEPLAITAGEVEALAAAVIDAKGRRVAEASN